MEFNKEQLNIIEAGINKNILVSAAAGSGKTTVLTERIIRKVLGENCGTENISLLNVLVMTFTKKATAEMKTRIKKRLDDELSKNYSAKLVKESAIIQNANISTIDSFCKMILEENYTSLNEGNSLYYDFDPTYRVADEKEMAILKEDVLVDLLEEEYGNEYFKSLFDSYVEKTNEDDMKRILSDGMRFLSSVTWPAEYLNRHINHFEDYERKAHEEYKKLIINESCNISENLKETRDAISEYCKVCRETLECKLNAKGNKLTEKQENSIDKSLKSFSDFYAGINSYLENSNSTNDNDESAVQNIKKILNIELVYPIAGTMKNYDKTSLDKYKSIINDAIKDFKQVIKKWRVLNLDENIVYNLNDKLYLELLLKYYLKVVEEKKKRNMYEISDYAALSLDILYDKRVDESGNVTRVISDRAKEIGNKFKLIFVDEYQDTNYIQEKLIAAISDDFKKGNVFMVGDVKQSIYGFRNAEPTIFVNKYRQFKETGNGVNMTLSVNYRSTKEIIEYVNDLFSKTMTLDFGDIDYNDGNALVPRDDEKKKVTNDDSKVEIHVVYKKDKEKGKEENKYTLAEIEADYVASEIEKLVSLKKKKYSDIVVLLRSTKNKGKIFEEALRRHKIPSYSEQKTGFFERHEIRLMTDILEIIDNPMLNIPLVGVLESSVFEFSNDDISFIKICFVDYLKSKAQSDEEKNMIDYSDFILYDAFSHIASMFSLYDIDKNESLKDVEKNIFENNIKKFKIDSKKLKAKVDKFLTLYSDIQLKSRYISISSLIEYIYDKLKLKDIVASMSDGKMRKENLNSLYSFAVSYENSSYVGLFNFNRYIKMIKEIEKDQGQAKIHDESANVVRIMTIHSSKGLQFDTVFLSLTNTLYNFDDSKATALCQFDQEYGVSLDYYNDELRYRSCTPKKQIIASKKKDNTILEELRMLYVALTRAENKLYITGNALKTGATGFRLSDMRKFEDGMSIGENISKDLRSCDCYLDVVLSNYPIKNDLPCKYISTAWDIDDVVDEEEEFSIDTIDKDLRDEKEYEKNDKDYFDGLDSITLEENLVDKYSFSDYQKIKPKMSVSDIKLVRREEVKTLVEAESGDIDEVRIDKKNEDMHIVDGIELGNAYHRYMQFYNYDSNKYENNKEKEDEFTPPKVIKKQIIDEFLSSDIGKEMSEAYKKGKLYREYKFMKLYSKSDIDIIVKNNDAVDNNIKIDIINEKNIVVQGIIDAFFVKSDEHGKEYIVLVDYKTDALSKQKISKEQVKKDLINNYKVQIDIYANALSDLTGLEVRDRYLYSFAIGEAIKV